MKKFFCILLLSTVYVFSVKAQFNLGVRAGMNVSSLTGNYEGYVKNGPMVGITGSYTFHEQWRLQTGLLFSTKGQNGLVFGEGLTGKDARYSLSDIRMYYLELPVTIGYKIPLSNHIYLTPEAGAFFACGLGGKAEYKTNVDGGYLLTDWNPFEDGKLDAFNRFDSGMRFGVSADVYKFSLSVHYDLGLVNLQDQLGKTDKMQSRSLSISLGYNFF